MNRFPPLTKEQILDVLDVNIQTGTCIWKNVSKYHNEKNGREAGFLHITKGKQPRWLIRINTYPYRRAQLIFAVANGYWPELIDHIDGNAQNDVCSNLREATITQNNWNHRTRAKNGSLPMGIRHNGPERYTARIGYLGKLITLGTFSTVDEAVEVYRTKRRELFGEFCGESL